MTFIKKQESQELTEHFFRNEYGKMVAVITKYIGTENVQTAEDIVQETLLKATEYWKQNGIPKNPQAWLYTTSKNLTLNFLKRKKLQIQYEKQLGEIDKSTEEFRLLEISTIDITDEQLKMMFVCCHPKLRENSQITLILKILCGFSIAEISNAFFTSNDTINKRLVRGRKELRVNRINFELPKNPNERLPSILKTIYLLFNEGYSPSHKDLPLRHELCFEAIRLCEILVNSNVITKKHDCCALLSLMYFNTARFNARVNETNSIVEMEKQNRNNWNQKFINKGLYYINKAMDEKEVSNYLVLATISANHCIAPSFEETNWKQILSLYDSLIHLDDTPVVRLNRGVVLSKVKGNKIGILELENLRKEKSIRENHLLYATLGELYKLEGDNEMAITNYKKAISLSKNQRDIKLFQKKLMEVVPI